MKRWTSQSEEDLRAMYADGYVLSMMARKLGASRSSVRNRVHMLGLKRNFYRRPIAKKEVAVVSEKYADTPTRILARKLGRTICSIQRLAHKLGIKKSQAFMSSPYAGRIRPGTKIGATFQFLPGHVPANKGLRRPGYAPGRMRETQFKKGHHPHTYLPVGTVKLNGDGYLVRKIADDRPGRGACSQNWEFVHRRVWEDVHGPIPKGHRIWWKDRNHENCALKNLELLTDAEHMARTTIHNLPPELKETIMLAGRLKRRIRRKSREEQAKRSPQSSVRNDRKAQGRKRAHGH